MKKKTVSLILILISLFIVSVSSPYASNNNLDNMIMAKVSIDQKNVERQDSINQENPKSSLPTNYDIARNEYISLKNAFRQTDESKETNSSFRSYLTEMNTPDAMVNDLTFEFSKNNKKPPGFDIGLPSSFSDVFQFGVAFLTNLTAHEFGHDIVAGHVGAKGRDLNFFQKQNGSFFLGTSSVTEIEPESKLSYHMGGEFFADITFEHALKQYRNNPTTYNKSLLLFSGTDFAWYCLYAYYLTDEHSFHDPISIQKETGLSKDVIFSIALAKTLVNTYRVYSGNDYVIPYFSIDNDSASVNFAMSF